MMEKSKMQMGGYGSKVWRNSKGQLHNEEGPAIIYPSGSKYYYINGISHRENGPSDECGDNTKRWYLNNEKIK